MPLKTVAPKTIGRRSRARTTKTRPTRRSSSTKASETRTRIIEAAIETINAEGFYRASSYAIARRAGVSWGSIQYYFGSQEALLHAVFEHYLARNMEIFANAQVRGDCVEERLAKFADIVFSVFDDSYMPLIQIELNFSGNKSTNEGIRAAMHDYAKRQTKAANRLLGQVSPALARSKKLRSFVLYALMGLALVHTVREASYRGVDIPEVHPDRSNHLSLMLRALVPLCS